MNALNQLQALGLELIVIPPLFPDSDSDCVIGESFSSPHEHKAAISEVQRFRGRVYVADGAIPTGALPDDPLRLQHIRDPSFDRDAYLLDGGKLLQRPRNLLPDGPYPRRTAAIGHQFP